VDFLPGNAQCSHFTISAFPFRSGFGFEFAGDAEAQLTSRLASGVSVPTPAQAASMTAQATAIRVRNKLKEKQEGNGVMGKRPEAGDKTCFCAPGKQGARWRKPDTSTRRKQKKFHKTR